MWAARKRFLVGFGPRDRAEENKTSCPEREKKKNQTEYPEIKSLSLPSRSHNHCAVSPPLLGESRNKCLSSEPRNFCNLPPPGERYLYAAGGGGCVLQFLPCQPSILERMKQPWRIWAVQLTSRAGLRIPAGAGFSAPA